MAKVRALVLIEATSSQTKRIKDEIRLCPNGSGCSVESADALTGQYDFAVNVEGDSFDNIVAFVTRELNEIEGVARTHTFLKINDGA